MHLTPKGLFALCPNYVPEGGYVRKSGWKWSEVRRFKRLPETATKTMVHMGLWGFT